MKIRTVSPDKAKAENLLENAQGFIRAAELIEKSDEVTSLINIEYDTLHTIALALLSIEGEKIQEKDHHMAIIQHISAKHTLSKAQEQIFDDLRKTRNDINYYGQKDKIVLKDFYERNKETVHEIRTKLLSVLLSKLKEQK